MSTTMVGDEAELKLKSAPIETDGSKKEIKKVGLINSFFKPVTKSKEDAKSKLGAEKTVNCNQGSDDGISNRIITEIFQKSNQSGLFDQKEKCSNKKTRDDNKQSSEEELPLRTKQTKPKWSVTCAVRNSSKCLSSSGSEFEDDGKSLFTTKTKEAEKSKKNKERTRPGSDISAQKSEGISSMESVGDEDKESKSIKKSRKSVKKVKTRTGSKCNSGTQESNENSTERMEVEEKERRSVIKDQTMESNKTSIKPGFGQEIELITDKYKPDNKSKASSSSEENKEVRTSAFDVLMKSQRVQKTEDHSAESSVFEASQTAVIPCDIVVDNSSSCEITDVKEKLHSEATVTCQSKPPSLTGESSSDKIGNISSSGTNAFDFLMKKGRLGKSPCGVDSQVESELETEALETVEGPLKKKSKKKSFEFQLSIRASKKNDIEFSIESESVGSGGDNCQDEEKAEGKSKKKTRKHKKNSRSDLAEGKSDQSFVGEKCEEEGREVSRCKRGKKKSTGKSKVNTEEDSADVSLLEVNSEKAKRKSEKKRRKPGRKGVSNAEIFVMDVDPKEANDDKNFEPSIQNVLRKKAKPQRSDEKNRVDIQEKNCKKKRKSKKSDKDSLAEQLPSIEGKQTEASNFKDMDEVVQTKMGKDQNEAGSSHNTKIKAVDRNERADKKREMETEFEHDKKNSVSSEPKTLAAIFLKRKPVPSKPDITEENQTTAISSASSTSVTCPVNVSASMTNEQSTIDKEHPQPKEKSTVEKEAANRAFKALFTGASSQKTAPSNSIADALPAPWPSVSHVFQKDGDASLDGNFWHLPWPIVKDHKFDVSLHSYLFLDGPLANLCHDTSALSTQDHIMFCGRRDLVQSLDNSYKLERKTAHPNFPEAVTKKLLSELALFYPGVPLRKLYKRYATKLQKYKASSVAVESKQVVPVKKMPVDDATSNLKLLESKKGEQEVETKSFPGRRGRGKRRLSSDGGVRQEQKIARKSGDFFTTVPSEDQGLSADHSGNKSRKKRQREEDSDQPPEKACKGRRLSTRLQEKKAAVEMEPVDDNLPQPETSSNRKKRKITDSKPHATEMRVLSKEEEKSPDAPDIANSEETLSFVSDTMWTDLYRPVHSTEVMANASAVSKLRSWLEEWKIKREKTLRKELQQQRRLLAKQKGKLSSSQSSSHTLEWWDADSDSDFQMSDDDSDDSDTEGVGLSTAMFISGPTGVGKTAMVYACAEELGYKVFEVNSSSKRSGKHILSQLEEATQSHLVINNQPTTTSKGPVPESSFAGLFSKPVKNSPSASGPLGAFLQPTGSASQSKDKKGEKGSKGKNGKEKKEKTKVKGKSILKQPSQAASNDGTESNLSTKAASLILFEEVDVIFEEDKSFWMAVNSFLQNAKCPIVLISTESQVSCEGWYDQITLKQPSVNLLAAHLQLVGLMNNMFINPEDLKSLVARNNCDIRKSLLNLQFWSASGGGVKIPYKRPASLKDKGTISDKSQTPQPMSISHTTNTACVMTDVLPSQEVQHLEPIITGGVLNDGGEESMFLSLSDWQVIKSGGLRRSSRSLRSGSLKPTEGGNSDSDFCEPKRKTLVCADGSTDSIFEITDTNDSQPVSSSDKRPDDSFQLPHMDSLLFESVHGLLNCVPEPNKGSLSVLQKEEKPGVTRQDNNSSEKLHLAHFSQVLGVNVTHTNLCDLMPLFVDSSSSQQKENSELQAQESKSAPPVTAEDGKTKSENIFSDTSLFDDGTESCDNKMADERGLETGTCPEKELEECNTKNASSSQESTDTGFSESQVKEETGEGRQDQGHEIDKEAVVQKGSKVVHRKSSDEEKRTSKALEIFAQFAENMSFADAYCPNLSCTQSNSAQYGWWGAPLKPGLTDEHVTVQESRNWLACDTRASISGALEVANLESCFVKVKLLTEDLKDIGNSPLDGNTEDQTSIGKSELCNFNILSEDLPAHDSNEVLRLDAVTQTQKSSVTSRRKLYNSLGSSIPVLNHCNHRSVVCDYIPTFRLLCHSERLREAAHIKRRFLHYLDSNSFPMSHSTMDALADSYLVH